MSGPAFLLKIADRDVESYSTVAGLRATAVNISGAGAIALDGGDPPWAEVLRRIRAAAPPVGYLRDEIDALLAGWDKQRGRA